MLNEAFIKKEKAPLMIDPYLQAVKNMNNFAKMNRIYEMYFAKNFPPRCCVGVSSLLLDADIEIEAIAFCD